MFTGIVTTTGEVIRVNHYGNGLRVSIKPLSKFNSIGVGDSVSVDGVCLTVEDIENDEFVFYLSQETLSVTKFRQVLKPRYKVNLEPPVTPSSFFGGHLVTGHVDTVGKITKISRLEETTRMEILLNSDKEAQYIVKKGSVAIDGVSLTVNEVRGLRFDVLLIPHTLKITNLGERKSGDPVNIEFDLIAKYVLKSLTTYTHEMRR